MLQDIIILIIQVLLIVVKVNIIQQEDIIGNIYSGYSDEDRKAIWNNKDELLGRIIEVQYFEETENQNDDSLSLRFPVFLRIREKGKEVSYN